MHYNKNASKSYLYVGKLGATSKDRSVGSFKKDNPSSWLL